MPLIEFGSIRARLRGLILGATVVLAASSTAHAETDPTLFYIYSITAPALEGGCEDTIPGFAQDFDFSFERWSEGNQAKIAASRQAFMNANPGKSEVELVERVATRATQDFATADLERRQEVCKGLLTFLIPSDTE